MDLLQFPNRYLRIDLCRAYVRLAKHRLDVRDFCAVLTHQRCHRICCSTLPASPDALAGALALSRIVSLRSSDMLVPHKFEGSRISLPLELLDTMTNWRKRMENFLTIFVGAVEAP